MIRHAMRYAAPRTAAELLDMAHEFGTDAAVLGGGTWLLPNMTTGRSRPRLVLDPRHLSWNRIEDADGLVCIGARTTYAAIAASELVARHVPLLARVATQITGGRAITGQATPAGAACYGSPASDAPGALVATSAMFRLVSVAGTRDVHADDFFQGAFATARREDEVLTELRIPKAPAGSRVGYAKLKLATGSWPIVTASCIAGPPGTGLRVVIGGAATRPVTLERPLDRDPDDAEALEIGRAASDLLAEPWSDELADGRYRSMAAPAVVQDALLAMAKAPLR